MRKRRQAKTGTSRNRKGNKSAGLTPQEARLRTVKGWRTREAKGWRRKKRFASDEEGADLKRIAAEHLGSGGHASGTISEKDLRKQAQEAATGYHSRKAYDAAIAEALDTPGVRAKLRQGDLTAYQQAIAHELAVRELMETHSRVRRLEQEDLTKHVGDKANPAGTYSHTSRAQALQQKLNTHLKTTHLGEDITTEVGVNKSINRITQQLKTAGGQHLLDAEARGLATQIVGAKANAMYGHGGFRVKDQESIHKARNRVVREVENRETQSDIRRKVAYRQEGFKGSTPLVPGPGGVPRTRAEAEVASVADRRRREGGGTSPRDVQESLRTRIPGYKSPEGGIPFGRENELNRGFGPKGPMHPKGPQSRDKRPRRKGKVIKGRRTITTEELYESTRHEDARGVKGIRGQYNFITGQISNTITGLRTGNYYLGRDARGKPVSPESAKFGVTANKHWRFRMTDSKDPSKHEGTTEEFVTNIRHLGSQQSPGSGRKGSDLVDPVTGVYSSDKERRSHRKRNTDVFTPGRESRYETRPFGSSKDNPEGALDKGELVRSFERTGAHLTQGKRRLAEETPLPYRVDERIIVPVRGITKRSSKTETYHVENAEGERTQKRRQIMWVPYNQTKLASDQKDTLSVVVPGTSRFGERRAFAHLDDNHPVGKHIVEFGRARDERLLREDTEYIAKSQDRVNNPKLQRYKRALADTGIAGASAALLQTRNRAQHLWFPRTVNRVNRTASSRSSRYRRWSGARGWNNGVFTDAHEALVRPALETAINWKFKVRHPLSSPEGNTMGVRWGKLYYDKTITFPLFGEVRLPRHRDTASYRDLQRSNLQAQRLNNTDKFFHSAYGSKSRFKRALVKRRDHLQRHPDYQMFGNAAKRSTFLDEITHEANMHADRISAIPSSKRTRRESRLLKLANETRITTTNIKTQASARNEPIWNSQLAKILPNTGPHGAIVLASPRPSKFSKLGDTFSQNRSSILVGGAVIGTAVGAGYLYHRHQRKKEVAAGLDPKSAYNRFIPGKKVVRVPTISATKKVQLGNAPIFQATKMSGRRIPVEWNIGMRNKTVWKGTPQERGYGNQGLGLTGLSLRGTPGGKIGQSIAPIHDGLSRRPQKIGTHDVYIKGKKLPLKINIGRQDKIKLQTRNPNRLNQDQRERLAAEFGLTHLDRSQLTQPNPSSSVLKAVERERSLRQFYSEGKSDKQLFRMLDNSDEVRKVQEKFNTASRDTKRRERQRAREDEVIGRTAEERRAPWGRPIVNPSRTEQRADKQRERDAFDRGSGGTNT